MTALASPSLHEPFPVRPSETPAQFAEVISPYLPPIARIYPGGEVAIRTVDCFNGELTSEDQVPGEVLTQHLNPLTGPFWLEGAEPGDTLAVSTVDIRPTRDWAVSWLLLDS